MSIHTMSRRDLLKAGTNALVGTSGVLGATSILAERDEGSPEQLIRTYYSGYEQKDWNTSDGVLADNFTFTSPNGDDHINKAVFKQRCFVSQLDFIQRFDLESVFTRGDEGFVKYLCHTTKNTAFRNMEFFRFVDGKIASIECYFGGQLGYPTAAATGKP
jgi:ketosteroid isomerase-like protein